jgi:hypothetical protein
MSSRLCQSNQNLTCLDRSELRDEGPRSGSRRSATCRTSRTLSGRPGGAHPRPSSSSWRWQSCRGRLPGPGLGRGQAEGRPKPAGSRCQRPAAWPPASPPAAARCLPGWRLADRRAQPRWRRRQCCRRPVLRGHPRQRPARERRASGDQQLAGRKKSGAETSHPAGRVAGESGVARARRVCRTWLRSSTSCRTISSCVMRPSLRCCTRSSSSVFDSILPRSQPATRVQNCQARAGAPPPAASGAQSALKQPGPTAIWGGSRSIMQD